MRVAYIDRSDMGLDWADLCQSSFIDGHLARLSIDRFDRYLAELQISINFAWIYFIL